MRVIEQTCNDLQQKSNQQNGNNSSSSGSKTDQTIKELQHIHRNVEDRLGVINKINDNNCNIDDNNDLDLEQQQTNTKPKGKLINCQCL